MRSEHDSHAILDRALTAANTPDADATFISTDQNISRFANSGVHQNMSEISAALTLRVIVNGCMGVASTSSFDDEGIANASMLAHEAAKHAGPLLNFSGLYRGNEPTPLLTTFDPKTAAVSPIAKARALREMFDRGRDAGVHFAGSYATGGSSVACANTHGVRRYATMSSADATVIAIRGGDSGYATSLARHFDDVDVLALGEEATFKATLKAGVADDLQPGAFDVILEPPALSEVLEWLNMIAFSGTSFDDGSSFFVGHLGDKLLGDNFTLVDDSIDDSFMPFPFDLEGLPKRRVALIERGVIRTPVVDKAYADRLNLPPTANTWHLGSSDHGVAFHLAMDGGDATREELIRSTKHGIWVTRFNYVNGLLEPRVAQMTGTTRDGTFLIRDGEVVARLPNLRWTESMVEAFGRIEGLTSERRRVGTWFNHFGGTLAPTVKIAGWNFTGKQELAGA
jgi:predicted Zn-dependent protease